MKPEVIMTVGVPGSGKTTYATSLDATRWVNLTLDDYRSALFGHKKVYHHLVGDNPEMRRTLHTIYNASLTMALRMERNVIMANTHLSPREFAGVTAILQREGIVPYLRVYDVSLETLLERNQTRPADDRVSDDLVKSCFDRLWAKDAWWRSHPAKRVTIVNEHGEAIRRKAA